MKVDIIQKLESNGFKVSNRGYVSKYSQKTRRSEVAGQINDAGVYFYAQNVAPFQQGLNTYKDLFGVNVAPEERTFNPIIIKEAEHDFSFNDYISTTQKRNQFQIYLKGFHKQYFSTELTNNKYDIRGVKDGYLDDATLFPYINYDNDFLTAKIVKYNTNTGKRSKDNFSNSWFHSYKSIKKDLGIKDKITKKIDCFFGEHLLAFNNKPVVIVEAEKTAIILSYFFPNIVFLASGGLNKLEGLDYDFLANRKVYLFPDNGAKQWFDIAEKRGWWISKVLETSGSEGNDAIDYLITHDADETHDSIWWLIHDELYNIEANIFENDELLCTSLNFQNKHKISFSYCLPNLLKLGLNYYKDNAKGESFRGEYFKIYKDDFKLLNANIDFNKTHKTEFGWQQLDAPRFLKKLEKCFRITKHLNPEAPYKKLFSEVLLNLVQHSNHTFNISYVERVLIPFWDAGYNSIGKYEKYRNWRFSGGDGIEKENFRQYLNNDQKLFKTHTYLKALKPFLSKRIFILPEYIKLHHKIGNEFVWDIIKQYNKEVIGCSTIKTYKGKLKVSKYLNKCVKKYNDLNPNNKCPEKFDSTYISSNISCQEKQDTFKIPSIRTISEKTEVSKDAISDYKKFKPDLNLLTDLKTLVGYYIDNPQDFEFIREKDRLHIKPSKTIKEIGSIKIKEFNITPKEAFDYPLDLTGSVLNCSKEVALKKGGGFSISWIAFNYPDATEIEKDNRYMMLLHAS